MKPLNSFLPGRRFRPAGFSLIEMMTAMTVLTVLLVIVFQMFDAMQTTWKRTRQRVNEFRDSNIGFEQISRRLGQATLNTYWGYEYGKKNIGEFDVPFATKMIRQSELHFVSGPSERVIGAEKPKGISARPGHAMFFVTPAGVAFEPEEKNPNQQKFGQLKGLLNAWGFFVQFAADDMPKFLGELPNAPKPRLRYRLMEFRQPTEFLQIYKIPMTDKVKTKTQEDIYAWFRKGKYGVNSNWNTESIEGVETAVRTTRIVADNIVAMIVRPRDPKGVGKNTTKQDIAKDYLYDSRRWQWESTNAINERTRHVLPPIIDVTLVAVDDVSFDKFLERSGIKTADKDPGVVSEDLFQNVEDIDKDLGELIASLREKKISYRFYTRSIRIRESKWTDTKSVIP